MQESSAVTRDNPFPASATLPPAPAPAPRKNILVGSAWMVFLTLALFFLPAINGLIGGFVGGYKVGTVGRAFAASILPAILAGAGLWAILIAFELPIAGLFIGAGVGFLIVLSELSLIVGALVGGAMARRRQVSWR